MPPDYQSHSLNNLTMLKHSAPSPYALKLLLDNLQDPIIWVSHEAQVLHANSATLELSTEYPQLLADTLLYKQGWNLSTSVWQSHWQNALERHSSSWPIKLQSHHGSSLNLRVQLTAVSLEYGFLQLQIQSPLCATDPEGSPSMDASVNSPASDNNKQLIERARLKSIIDATGLGIVIFNLSGEIIEISSVFMEMWCQNHRQSDLKTQEQIKALINKYLQSPSKFSFKENFADIDPQLDCPRLKLVDGRTIEYWVCSEKSNSHVIGYVWSFRDITQRTKVENELTQSLKQERDLSDLRAQFLRVISHEFRSPLNDIAISANALIRYQQRWTETDKIDCIESVQFDVQKLTKLLDDVLSISQTDLSHIHSQNQSLNLIQFCTNLLDELKRRDNHQHPIVVNHYGDYNTILINDQLLRLILINLLCNAIKYSPNGEPIQLDIHCEQTLLTIEVQDRGIGISSADQVNIFNPFCRGSNVKYISGLGLGLTIVKMVVDFYGGSLEVISAINRGSLFRIILPLCPT